MKRSSTYMLHIPMITLLELGVETSSKEKPWARPEKFTYISLIFFIMECSFSNYLYTLSRHIMFEFLSVWILKNEEGSR